VATAGEVVPGDARAILTSYVGPIDLLFIDAEKNDYPEHLLAAVVKLRVGGVILADNVTSHDVSAYQSLLGNDRIWRR
jgi:predicted O-methyltransferase YrrM